jgi:carboxyl-terminal processing protease
MMKAVKSLLYGLSLIVLVTGCYDDIDDELSTTTTINDFVWKAMNFAYLYKSEVSDLNDTRVSPDDAYRDYLNSFSTPEAFFGSLLYEPETIDRFSVIFDNYFDVLNAQQGTTLTTGMEFNLYRVPGNETEVFGAVTLVLKNGPADLAGIERGQIFRNVDGVSLNESNFSSLLSQNNFTLEFADYNTNGTEADLSDDTITLNGESVQLSRQQYTENPVHVSDIIETNNTTIAYLMYNGFNSNFEIELNQAFGEFLAAGANELVLDLRYNPGGSIQTAVYLASMITGQYTGEVFSKLFYNDNLQPNDTDFLFESSIEGVGSINSLNLSRVYVLTTNQRTASASELIINSLEPYPIDVVVVGENTVGKTQGSLLLFDSPGLFNTEDINPTHTYVLRPLVANSVNVNEQAVPSNGLTPDIFISEVPFNLGILGDLNEPLLATAIADMTGAGRFYSQPIDGNPQLNTDCFLGPLGKEMYIDPKGFRLSN